MHKENSQQTRMKRHTFCKSVRVYKTPIAITTSNHTKEYTLVKSGKDAVLTKSQPHILHGTLTESYLLAKLGEFWSTKRPLILIKVSDSAFNEGRG